MSVLARYKLRLRRKRLLLRARRKSRELRAVRDLTPDIQSQDILCFVTARNERIRLPYFLDYYRNLGVDQFLFVDNGSSDGSVDYLAAQPDVSVWSTQASYRSARFGMDWTSQLLRKHGTGHWCLTVDPDEFLVYPFCETRPLRALTDWMDASRLRALPAMLLDMYPRGPLDAHPYSEGQNPFEIASWFDGGNYTVKLNPYLRNLWIQGGPRARAFFADDPSAAPALNKIPLVKWHARNVYVDSTHMLLPRGLNQVYATDGGERISGCLLHAKFFDTFAAKSQEELQRNEHYAGGREYSAYAAALDRSDNLDLWHEYSERYVSWRQLEILGLMSKGNWA
ncbi:glycosyltransferase family 2 protein [Tropicimonas sp. S265A]|uniref:glycosyltransferase family 2 protein n=1 Tax=Tropicimonas sp. S265A TaxID=3415134 RepID=UPI003C7A175B